MIKQESNVPLSRLLDDRQYEFHKGGFTLLQGKLFADRKLFRSSIYSKGIVLIYKDGSVEV